LSKISPSGGLKARLSCKFEMKAADLQAFGFFEGDKKPTLLPKKFK